MARKLGTPLDFQQNELRNPRVHNLGAAPSSPVTGQLYYDTSANKLYYYNGSSWVDTTGGAGAPADASTTVKGVTKLSSAPVSGTNPIAVGDNDARVTADQTAGTASIRTLGTGAQQAMAGNTRLDTIAAPTGAVSLNNQKLTNVLDPTSSQDAATKAYVDSVASGLDAKSSVKAASTGNLTLSGTQTVDGVALVAGDRVLVKDQTTTNQNGIYVVAAGAWTRATDADSWTELVSAFTFVEQGTVNADNGFVSTVDAGGTLGTTAVTWTQFSGAGQIAAGAALTKSGNTLDVAVDNSTIEVNADALRIKDAGIDLAGTKVTGTLAVGKGGTGQTTAKSARETGLGAAGFYFSETHGAGTTISIPQATHGLRASKSLQVQTYDVATGDRRLDDISVNASGDVTVTFSVSQSANTIGVSIVG